MKSKLRKSFILFCLSLSACGQPESAPEITVTPEPTPIPYIEPVLKEDGPVTFNGIKLLTSCNLDNIQYIKLSEAVTALDSEFKHDMQNHQFTFPWRNSEVILQADSSKVKYLNEIRDLNVPPILCDNQTNLYVPVKSFCDAIEIGLYYDEEFDHLYCTPGAGSWQLPQGYNVPIMMYHGIQVAPETANLFVDPYMLDLQLEYLTENGYTTIFFEDLWNVDNIEKPVILTFDDGWANNYSDMFPVLKKYNCKATIFIITDYIHPEVTTHLSFDNLHELADSELISIQSHTVTHRYLDQLSREEQLWELTECKKFLTRETGKTPFALCYPTGRQNDTTLELVREHYRFGVKMMTYPYSCYNTSDDPTLVYRFFPERLTPLDIWISWLEQSFPEENTENIAEPVQ